MTVRAACDMCAPPVSYTHLDVYKRQPQARSFDALIAAVAISHGLPIHTANPGDFSSIDDLTVVPVRRVDAPDAGPP